MPGYGLWIFLIGAIVLIVLGIIASASTSLQALGVWWYTWFMASFLSFLTDILVNRYVGAQKTHAPN